MKKVQITRNEDVQVHWYYTGIKMKLQNKLTTETANTAMV